MVKITFGQWDTSSLEALEHSFDTLRSYLDATPTDILLLPEMPFDIWNCASPDYDRDRWEKSIRLHDEWISRLEYLKAAYVVGTTPYRDGEANHNVGWVYHNREITHVHGKRYLPNEEGFWEANWYQSAPIGFEPFEIGDLTAGVMICTDLWFLNHARDMGQQGIDLLLVPRSTPFETINKWRNGCQTAAIVSGAFTLSSNHYGMTPDNTTFLAGHGFAIDPDGHVLAETNKESSWITLDIDPKTARDAKLTYPRYVKS